MKVTVSTLEIEGALLEGDNPLPMFRSPDPHRKVLADASIPPELVRHMGEHTGERYLPYRMQDRYSRKRRTLRLKTIELENDVLRAVFLPEYGGRLYSLKDKKRDREILYRNPVFQPANLAILNAWFSGGIEWNIGHIGHTFTTSSPMHAAKLIDGDGNEFVRMYEYERMKNVFWHIDFHLPQGSEQLLVYVRIVNDNDKPVPMYWWTNIAVQETEGARVFSATDEAIYIEAGLQGHAFGKLPGLPSVPDADVSYPMSFPYSSEYFFQTPAECRSPWEAVAYEDGRLFYERSTSLLRYRKMFCWGHHPGGMRWRDFLANPGEGGYIEVQGGFAPTQLHGLEMPAHTEWDFTQAIGMTDIDAGSAIGGDWGRAREAVEHRVGEALSEEGMYAAHEMLRSLAELTPTVSLQDGSGWGALEQLRRSAVEGRAMPAGFAFADRTLDDAQRPWLDLLYHGRLSGASPREVPPSWVVQDEWAAMLADSLDRPEGGSWEAYLHYGVVLFENGRDAEAVEAWERSLAIEPSAWAYRNLAQAMVRRGEHDEALAMYERAFAINGEYPDRALAEEHLSLLVRLGRHERAWELYESLPPSFMDGDRIRIIVGAAALALGKDDYMRGLFETEFAVIREGEVQIIELWYKYHAGKLAASRGVAVTPELADEAARLYPPPSAIDFRMIAGQ
ncbi:DUF5107 domain-containing protein [Cohnella sp. GCM10027633]|uniref:DUF5107 domain-containing protein n=1 Tax=unclassified Cohnella TaxID=2636738 RepID=UPI003636C834